MKQLKKAMAVIIAVLMALSLSLTASAAENEGIITLEKGSADSINGVKFDVYKLFDVSKNTQNASQTIYSISSDFTEFFSDKGLNISNAHAAYNYVLNSTVMGLKNELETYINEKTITPTTSNTGTENDSLTFASIPYGYYIIIPSNDDIFPSLVMLNGDTATVSIKEDEPTPDKKVDNSDSTSAKIGDKVSFSVSTKIPSMSGKSEYYFKFEDTMTDGLTLAENSVSVKIGNYTLENETNYDLEATTNTLVITFKDFYNLVKGKYEGNTLVITYNATVNTNALKAEEEDKESNEAKLYYGTNPNFSGEGSGVSNPDIVEVYNHDIIIINNDDSGNPISGGIFKITKGENGEEDLKLVKIDEYTYRPYIEGSDDSTDVITENKITIPDTGKVTIRGLDSGKYNVEQVIPPAGYNSLSDQDKKKSAQFLDNNNDNAELTFVNDDSPSLPETGGMGTVIFTVAGLALIAAVAGSFVISRKKKNS